MFNGGGGGWKPSTTFVATCLIVSLFYYLYSSSLTTTTTATVDSVHSRTRLSSSSSRSRGTGSIYDLPGTLSTHSHRLDGNLTGDSIPVWKPFIDNEDEFSLPRDHGRFLESLQLSIKNSSSSQSTGRRIIDPLGEEHREEEVSTETILFLGDSNERGIVDELCLKIGGIWPRVVSTKRPPEKSEMWHSDSHVCEIEYQGDKGKRRRRILRLVSFMSYGVLIEKDCELWEKKLELDKGPWSIEERIELAKRFLDEMGWNKIDLIVFNSNLWDLMYLHDTHLKMKTPYEFSLSFSTLNTYISRSVVALSKLLETFPETGKISLRTLHPLHPGRSVIDFFNSRRVVQINQAVLEILYRINQPNELEREKEVRLLDLGKVLEGWPTTTDPKGKVENLLKDKVHLDWNPGLWMYGEMVLDALYR
ncbi:hypothetical protein JCM5350_002789 [Sporobolomyces pararoseus]